MNLQLELLPYYYYNTLGFDAELIDYIDHVDDSIVLEKIAPLYKNGGRPPVDPRICFPNALSVLYASGDLLVSRIGETVERTEKSEMNFARDSKEPGHNDRAFSFVRDT